MRKCNIIPGLDHCYCKSCKVWLPTEYQIGILQRAHDDAQQQLADWKRGKPKSAKIPKSLKEKLSRTLENLTQAKHTVKSHEYNSRFNPNRSANPQ